MLTEAMRVEYRRLWKELVPEQGQAASVQGEVVRAVGRLSDEAFRNGNLNFGKNHKLLCKFLRETLTDPEVFNADELAEIDRCIDRILQDDCPDVDGTATSFHRMTEMAVRWCEAHSKLIPRNPNAKLTM